MSRLRFWIVGEPFSLWRKHVLNKATLRSDINASELFARDRRFSLREFLDTHYPPEEARRLGQDRIPVQVFKSYTHWVLNRLPYHPIEKKVTRIDARHEIDGGGFVALLDDGTKIATKRIVLASGIESHRVTPRSLEQLSPSRVSHSWQVETIRRPGKTKGFLLLVGGSLQQNW